MFLCSQRVPPLRVDDLIEDLKDGVRLIALLKVLANTKLVSKFILFSLIFLFFFKFER
jgi:hypothetical protein